MLRALLTSSLLAIALLSRAACAADLPKGFVYLRDVDPSIQQDMRYAGSGNFTGHPVNGYAAGECVLVAKAADALKATQSELRGQGLSLKVYDCYRPARAVAAFVEWAKAPDDPNAKATYYPSLSKQALFPGYIATRSGHSRGATVDLTLVALRAASETAPERNGDGVACTAPQAERSADTSLDMGTSFDCFDAKAHTAAPGLSEAQRRNRDVLLAAMRRHGFKNYANEWWHYTLEPEPYPDTIFDFPIVKRE